MSSLGFGAIRSVYFSSVFVWYRARNRGTQPCFSLVLRRNQAVDARAAESDGDGQYEYFLAEVAPERRKSREREKVWEGIF